MTERVVFVFGDVECPCGGRATQPRDDEENARFFGLVNLGLEGECKIAVSHEVAKLRDFATEFRRVRERVVKIISLSLARPYFTYCSLF